MHKKYILAIPVLLVVVLVLLAPGCRKDKLDSPWEVPKVTTVRVSTISKNSAFVTGNISNDGGRGVIERGFCWSTKDNPTISDNVLERGNDTGSFTGFISPLTIGTHYYVRAYATNGIGTAYGNVIEFNTLGLAILTTSEATDITQTTAVSGGNITSNGGYSVTESGICWGTGHDPRIDGNRTTDGLSTGIFKSNITGLSGGATYYVRAYATNSLGTSYGNEVTFITAPPSLPELTTNAVNTISFTTADCGGLITSDGSAGVTARGVCWSTNVNPTTADNKYFVGSGTGSFVCTINGLTLGTTYYVRAYATNAAGTAYGNMVSFKTLNASLPVLTTSTASNVSLNSANLGGNISSDGGAPILYRGVCWGTSSNPTTSDYKIFESGGIGGFAFNVGSLNIGTKYYARAYALNAAGTTYGNEISFITQVSLGQSYQGGIVAYILQSGDPGYDANVQHGIIAASTDQSANIRWYNGTYITTGATSAILGAGDINTTAIINNQGTTTTSYAAGLARAYNGGGYTDWYLPNKGELNKLYLNRAIIGGFTTGIYWSSSEYSSNAAWDQSFNTGNQMATIKSSTDRVRAIRKF